MDPRADRPAIVIVAAFAVALLLPLGLPEPHPARGAHGLFERVKYEVQTHYVHPVDDQELTWRAMDGLAGMDPYSGFMDPEETRRFREDTEGKFEGIGIYVDLVDGVLVVVAPLPGSPAEEAGIRAGDRILAVDGKDLTGLTDAGRATDLIKGPAGSSVLLRVRHRGEEESVELRVMRRAITVPSVRDDQILDDAEPLAYIRLTQFQSSTVREFDEAMERLQVRAPAGLILDLRGNPGGLLGTNEPDEAGSPDFPWVGAVGMADRFVASGKILTVDGRGEENDRVYLATGRRTLPGELRVAVLIDRGSASAAEILAGAIRDRTDRPRGVLLGQRSYGKGSVQTVVTVPIETKGGVKDSQVKLTTARYLTPSGRSLHREPHMEDEDEWGLTPDFFVEPAPRAAREGEREPLPNEKRRAAELLADPVVKRAAELLRDPAAYEAVLAKPPGNATETR